jgi:fucose permease
LVLTVVCQLVFWLVPSFYVSAIAVSLQGFFLGPLFPAAIVTATKALPPYLHVSAIGFAAAFSGGGGAVLPFATGALAQSRGVSILQPVILAILVFLIMLWVCLPTINKSPVGSPEESINKERRWVNIDIDIVEAGRQTIQKAISGRT